MPATFLDNKEELFIGAALQFPLYFVVGWWVIPVMIASALMWRYGGWEYGNKIVRRIGVPGLVCGSSILAGVSWIVLFAAPFMVWLAPSYGKSTGLYQWLKNDFLVRLICFSWYWAAYSIAYAIGR